MIDRLLSVCLITYNHEKYIRQAIDGILMQKVNFPWELIIADDCSTDGTTDIVKEYKKQYPNFIHLILQEKNVGPAKNWIDLITTPKSKYIAYFEGDDYWTDPLKLQKQVDFLEGNPDFAICYHNVEERFEDDETQSFLYVPIGQPLISDIYDLAIRNFIPTCAVLFRNNLRNGLPSWIAATKIGDWPLHIYNAGYGKIKYLPKVMGVHRNHTGGTWAMNSQQDNIRVVLETYDVLIEAYAGNKIFKEKLLAGRKNLEESLLKGRVKSKKALWHRIYKRIRKGISFKRL